jgi:DNA polymerase-3 subunit gamma/tau
LLYSICLHGRADLGLAPDEYAALTMVLLRLLAFKPQGVQPAAEKKTLNNPAPTSVAAPVRGGAPAMAPQPQQVAAPALAPVTAPVQPVMPPVPDRPVVVQPWEDAPAPASEKTAESAVPPGHVLPVRDSAQPVMEDEDDEENATPAPVERTQVATKIVAVPVRQHHETRADASAAQAAPVLILSEEGDFWHATVQQLIAAEAINAMVRELALQSQLIARDTDQWILRVERESLNQPATRDRLTTALQNAGFGVKLVVEVGRVTDSPGRRNSAASAEKQLAAEKIIFDDPFVQSMMRDFGAKIVPGSIKPL